MQEIVLLALIQNQRVGTITACNQSLAPLNNSLEDNQEVQSLQELLQALLSKYQINKLPHNKHKPPQTRQDNNGHRNKHNTMQLLNKHQGMKHSINLILTAVWKILTMKNTQMP